MRALAIGIVVAGLGLHGPAEAKDRAGKPVRIELTLNKLRTTDTNKVYCTSSPTTFAHDDGGVVTFDQFCATFRESANLTLAWEVSSNVTWINHRVHYAIDNEFFLKASPQQSFRFVQLGGTTVGCAPAVFQQNLWAAVVHTGNAVHPQQCGRPDDPAFHLVQ